MYFALGSYGSVLTSKKVSENRNSSTLGSPLAIALALLFRRASRFIVNSCSEIGKTNVKKYILFTT